jgi:DNA invertase Pin-like site-specific DNA recombinase
MKAAIYARVSTADQFCQMQLTELRGFAERMGWATVEYVEKASTRGKRPVFDALMAEAKMRRFDVVLVWKLDRFGRSVRQLVENIQALDQLGIRFVAPSQSIDTDQKNPTGRLLMHILAAVAEFERDLIRERVMGGITEYKRAFAAGEVGKGRHSRSGKDMPPHRPLRVFARGRAAELRSQGMSWRKISRALKIPVSTIRGALGQF